MSFSIDHILFPTDFSQNAERALPFAAEIASRSGAKLTLFHASQDTMDIAPGFHSAREQDIEDTSESFDELAARLQENDKYKNLEISTILQSGEPTSSLISEISESNPDLIVMGTKGSTGDRNIVFGSVTTNIISKSDIPVLAVPNGSSLDEFKEIVFTTDYKEGDWGALQQTIEFAKIFNSSIDVLHIAEQRNLESEIKFRGFRNLVKTQSDYSNIDFHLIREDDFFTGASDYLIDHPASLLVMVRYERTFWEKLSERNHNKEMAFYTKTPLLILMGDKHIETTPIFDEAVKSQQ